MAFTTEFVMGAGSSVEMFEPTFTPNTIQSRATLATQAVGAGQWLVAVRTVRNAFGVVELWINGTKTLEPNTQNGSMSTTAVVAGPGTVTIEGSSVSSGRVYIVRIGD